MDRRQPAICNARSELIERLRDIREDAAETMNEAARDLSVRRSEYDALLQGRARLAQRFDHHQNQIEQTCRALLEIYREANRGARSTPAPDYFTKPYAMARISYTGSEPNASARENLAADDCRNPGAAEPADQGHSRSL